MAEEVERRQCNIGKYYYHMKFVLIIFHASLEYRITNNWSITQWDKMPGTLKFYRIKKQN